MSIFLIWLTFGLSMLFIGAAKLKIIPSWPKVFIVSAISNAMMLYFYYMPELYGYNYYLLNTLRIVPLVLILVYLAQRDPAPNWTYRAVCLLLIFETITYGWHILAALNSPYYDQLSLTATVIELLIITLGGFNVRFSFIGDSYRRISGSSDCSTWVHRDQKGRI